MIAAMLRAGSVLAALVVLLAAGSGRADELKWVGCDSWSPGLAGALAEAFAQQTSVQAAPQGGDSTRGIREVASGAADVGCSARHKVPSPEERNAKLIPVGWDALVVITHPSNPVDRISERDLQSLLEGKITQWSALGGPDKPIQLLVREDPNAGADLLLREMLFKDARHEISKSARRMATAAEIEAAVARNPDAIAVTLFSRTVGQPVNALRLDGATASYETIASGEYPLSLPFYVVVPKRHSDTTKELVRFVKGAGQEIIKAQGSVTMTDGKDLFARYQRSIAEARKKARP